MRTKRFFRRMIKPFCWIVVAVLPTGLICSVGPARVVWAAPGD
jgi:hypothetical protein